MSLTKRIDQDLTESMKQKDEMKISALRLLKSAIKNKEIDKRKPLEDADIIGVVQGQIKSRKDSIEMYKQGNSLDRAKAEEEEKAIIDKYLPQQLSDEELAKLVDEAIKATYSR